MKRLCKVLLLSIMLCLLFTNTVLANQWNWESAPGNHSPSTLLDESVTRSTDTVHRYGRGEFLAEGSVEISNAGNGEIYVRIETLAYIDVDRIQHTVFLEYWDEDREDWVIEDYWEFEKTKEEMPNEELYMLTTGFTLRGYQTGLYYRVRGLHGVEYRGELEACSTRTHGVLITDR